MHNLQLLDYNESRTNNNWEKGEKALANIIYCYARIMALLQFGINKSFPVFKVYEPYLKQFLEVL